MAAAPNTSSAPAWKRLRVLTWSGSVSLALLGGAFLGFTSCGGYGWHRDLFDWTMGGLLLLLMIGPPRPRLRSAIHRALLAACVVSIAVVAESAGAAFYPDSPASGLDFLKRVMKGLVQFGC